MLISKLFITADQKILSQEDYEDSPEHIELTERLRKTLYYGRNPKSERPSLPVTEIAVELLQGAAPRELGKVDAFMASNLSQKASVSPCALMIGLIYIERLKHRNPEYLQQISSSDLFLISMMVASKYLYDEGVEEEVFNDEWSDSAKMETQDLNELERNFLSAIDWNLFVKVMDFKNVLNNIERRVAVRKGRERGFYIYSDLMVLMENDELCSALIAILRQICKVLLVCSVAYMAGVMTMVGSRASLAYLSQHSSLGRTTPLLDNQPGPALSHTPLPLHLPWNLHDLMSDLPQPPTLDHNESNSQGKALNANIDHSQETRAGSGRHAKNTRSTFGGHHDENRSEVGGSHKVEGSDTGPQSTFLGFLTLAVMRDAMLQFLRALREEEAAEETRINLDDLETTTTDGSYVCSCGCCHGNVPLGCQNTTMYPSITGSDATCWKSTTLGDETLQCQLQQCCCPSTINFGPWYTIRSKVVTHLHDIRVGFETMGMAEAVS